MFSLNTEIENVRNKNIYDLLLEINSSYYQGNFRSAVVICYTAIIVDTIDKLKVLSVTYSDTSASTILNKLKTDYSETNPKWETDLLEMCYERTDLFNAYEYDDIKYIKNQRNRAAHPSVNKRDDDFPLITITKETCLDVIRKSYEISFLKDVILGKKVLMKIIDNTRARFKSPTISLHQIRKLLNDEYFSQISDKGKNSIFSLLFKFIFKQQYDKKDETRDRRVNLFIFISLFATDKQKYLKSIVTLLENCSINYETNTTCIEHNLDNPESLITVCLSDLICEIPEIYPLLTQSNQLNLDSSLKDMYAEESDYIKHMEYRARTIIYDQNPLKLFETINNDMKEKYNSINDFDEKTLNILMRTFENLGEKSTFLFTFIEKTTDQMTYYSANKAMRSIMLFMDSYTEEHFFYLALKINNNSQFYDNFNFDSFKNQVINSFQTRFDTNLVNSPHLFLLDHFFSDFSHIDISSKYFELIIHKLMKLKDKLTNYELEIILSSLINRIEKSTSDLSSILKNSSLEKQEFIAKHISARPELLVNLIGK